MTNPYAKYLGDRDAVEVMGSTTSELERLAATLGPQGLEKTPAPGKWSAREILCHLADCELTFAFRLRQTLAEHNHVIQPFDQEKWAANYAGYTAAAALEVFKAVRGWNLSLIKNLPAASFARTVTHPERGAMTFQTIVETMAGHDGNHLLQLEDLADKFGYA